MALVVVNDYIIILHNNDYLYWKLALGCQDVKTNCLFRLTILPCCIHLQCIRVGKRVCKNYTAPVLLSFFKRDIHVRIIMSLNFCNSLMWHIFKNYIANLYLILFIVTVCFVGIIFSMYLIYRWRISTRLMVILYNCVHMFYSSN